MTEPQRPSSLLEEVIDVLASIAPEVRDEPVDPDQPLRDKLELDSMDHVHFAVALQERFGVEIPQAEYARWRCLSELVDYLGRTRRR